MPLAPIIDLNQYRKEKEALEEMGEAYEMEVKMMSDRIEKFTMQFSSDDYEGEGDEE